MKIEEKRQQHLAMQAVATGVPANTASVPRPFIGGPFALVATAAAAPVAPVPVRPASNNSNTNLNLHMDAASQVDYPDGYEHRFIISDFDENFFTFKRRVRWLVVIRLKDQLTGTRLPV